MTKLRKWILFALAPLWRCKWLLLVCLLITVGYGAGTFLTVANASVTVYTPASLGTFISYTEIHYGWPLEYEVRQVDSSLPLHRWKLWANVQSFSGLKLAANALVALLTSLLITYATAWRRARWGWQFQLKELVALVALIAAVLAYAAHLRSVDLADQRYLADLQKRGWVAKRIHIPWQRRPFRDLGLISENAAHQYWLTWENRSQGAFIDQALQFEPKSADVNQLLAEQARDPRRLSSRFIAATVNDPQLHGSGVEAFLNWTPSVSYLTLRGDQIPGSSLAQIGQHCPHVKSLGIDMPLVQGPDLRGLESLHHLESLLIFNCDPDAGPEIVRLAERLPQLELIYLSGAVYAELTPAEIATLRSRRGLLLTQ
ncbi:hypothetical protein [Blastopirellula retiformator]|uniref:Uncharacterized protein n=1 Tax=Blastopirellula retiformator TaxID=2527970 RepID=A0A5C5V516_9BACT|nr:hypothetical protein [Blastopirellula retiformator]TWT33069.1 hypothetical protein Enr8_28890 [Blastopirellula retiformator]